MEGEKTFCLLKMPLIVRLSLNLTTFAYLNEAQVTHTEPTRTRVVTVPTIHL
jgi:hypothetical protein